MRNIIRVALVAAGLLGALPRGQADVIVSGQLSFAQPGTNAVLVGIYAYTTSSDTINGFNFPFEVHQTLLIPSGAGNGLPTGLTFNSTPIQNALITPISINTSLNGALNIDGIVNAGAAPMNIPLSSNPLAPTHLFDFAFDVAPSVTLGTTYQIDLLKLAPIYSIAPSPANSTVSPATLVVTIVPESATLISCAATALLAVVAIASHRRARRAVAAAN
jgi:hypothetical protein